MSVFSPCLENFSHVVNWAKAKVEEWRNADDAHEVEYCNDGSEEDDEPETYQLGIASLLH